MERIKQDLFSTGVVERIRLKAQCPVTLVAKFATVDVPVGSFGVTQLDFGASGYPNGNLFHIIWQGNCELISIGRPKACTSQVRCIARQAKVAL
jgi:hypothetical protein